MMTPEKNIYILLSDTGSILTRMIKLFTRAPYNHASIVFDDELNDVYSFGRKKPRNPFIAGFVKENVHEGLFSNAKCSFYSCSVDSDLYEQIYLYVQKFEQDSDQYKYNLLGLFYILLNIEVRRKNAYFCSEFVAAVFAENGLNLAGKSSALTQPADFENSDCLHLLFEGDLCVLRRSHKPAPHSFIHHILDGRFLMSNSSIKR
ncbi:MAG TPA: hypothetical protein VGI33_16820 [Paenibacillus sp.]